MRELRGQYLQVVDGAVEALQIRIGDPVPIAVYQPRLGAVDIACPLNRILRYEALTQ